MTPSPVIASHAQAGRGDLITGEDRGECEIATSLGQLAAAKTAHDKTTLERQIDATDRQIDQLVYELYDLTDEEIGIIEKGTAV